MKSIPGRSDSLAPITTTKRRVTTMATAKKGSCGGTPRVGKKGDPKPTRGGKGRGQGRNSKRK